MYTIFGERFVLGQEFAPVPEDFDYAKNFLPMVEHLLAEGKITPHQQTVGRSGLQGVLQGLEDMRNGKVSGQKLVYRVAETP
jgi:hypothetical protein